MPLQPNDEAVLRLWSHTAGSIADGYDNLCAHYSISPGRAKGLVHRALERRGASPHHSPSLVKAWLNYKRRYGKGTDLT